jgi:hypothetical protein
MSENGLNHAMRNISAIDKNIVYFIEAVSQKGRHMYAKSPFRKENIKKRISEDLPKNLDKLSLALPDGNEGDNSS